MSRAFGYSNPRRISPYRPRSPLWRRALGCVLLLLALGLLAGSAILLLTAPGDEPAAAESADAATEARHDHAHDVITRMPPTVASESPATISPAQIASLLSTPPEPIDAAQELINTGLSADPFTVVGDRSRTKMTTYTVVKGDTVDAISRKFGLDRESIVWCNHYRYALVLRPGDVVNIPPVDGACHTVLASQGMDITAIADKYGVDDPYAIIDAPANNLPDIPPQTLLPSNTRLFIPGGLGSIITWNAPVQEDSSGNVIAFASGDPSSCGAVAGGGTYWTNPLPNGTWVRGFYAGHSGIDLAAVTGTPIFAANGGPILYAGWNRWGYGNTVVIGHGPFSTLYGHLHQINVRCGMRVNAGQPIGTVGNTGNSTGPHLHFEIRYRNEPQDPVVTPGIGW